MATLGRLARLLASAGTRRNGAVAAVCGATGLVLFAASQSDELKQKWQPPQTHAPLTYREQRFLKFASAEYGGQVYMTPLDFLESILDQEPRPRLKRRVLTETDLEAFRTVTPSTDQGSSSMFRTIRDRGIISYTEYLFLLSVLVKPQSGFRIAFNMFDRDGDQRVDKSEYMVIENIFSHVWKSKHGLPIAEEFPRPLTPLVQKIDDERGLQRRQDVPTTLTTHFFSKGVLRYDDFRRFMENLQREVVEQEFSEFSKGADRISEMDFAKILLRYTYLDSKDCDVYLRRLLSRLKEERGIGFEEFCSFCRFLNNIEDFTFAMKMFNIVGRPVTEAEFQRAVKICGGSGVSRHLVHTVFQLFDVDGDGKLSHKEFVTIMKDRLRRRFKAQGGAEVIDNFKSCVKRELGWRAALN